MVGFLPFNKNKIDIVTWSYWNIIYVGKKFVRKLKLPDYAIKPKSWKLAVGVFRLEKKKKKGNETVVNSHWNITSQKCQPTMLVFYIKNERLNLKSCFCSESITDGYGSAIGEIVMWFATAYIMQDIRLDDHSDVSIIL